SSRRSLDIAVEALGGETHELWSAGEVPVGIDHLRMTDVNRQRGETTLDHPVPLVEAHGAAHDKRVAQIVKPVMSVVSAYLQPELSAQRMQRVEHASLIHGSAVVAQEEAIAARAGHELVAQPRI